MVLNKALFIKVLTGLTTIAATATPLALNWEKITNSSKNEPNPSTEVPSAQNQNTQDTTGQVQVVDETTLTTAVGLTCSEASEAGVDCTIDASKLRVDQGGTKTEGFNSPTTSGKIKLYKGNTGEGYKQNLKFVIESGDISLTTTSDSSTTIKLEEFETYQIEEDTTTSQGDTKKYYLTRKEKAADEIRRTLGLPEGCSFPESDNTTKNCSFSEEEIKSINFEGKSGTVTNSSSSTLSLTITKVSDTTNYPLGYKFSFKTTGSGNITVSTTSTNTPITFRPNSPVDFKIKKEGNNGKDLKLEKDLTLNTLLSEVGLSVCTTTTGSNECNISTDGLNVKQDSNKEEGRTKDTSSSSGKIKVYSDSGTPSYENNFKFVIEEGDIGFSNSSGKQITKLEQFETYEIKKETSDNKYYLTKKTKAADGIKTALGLPDNCNLDNGCSDVDIDSNNIKKIKFDGLSGSQEPSFSGSSKLTVSKENTTDSDFPYGYKFTFKGKDKDETLTINSKQITLKQSGGTEFRIKKATSGNNITLEEAWSLENLLKEVGLSGCTTDSGSNECTIGSLKVKQGDNKEDSKTKDTSNGGSTGKIKVSKENTTTDYNKGFKFVIEDGDISFSGSGSITKLEEFETYEIKKETSENKWYFSRKKDALEEKRRILGLPTSDESCKLPSSSSETKTCSNITEEQLKAIKFEGKNSSSDTTMDSSGSSVTLKITKTDDTTTYPNGGYKFVFETTQSNITIPKSSSGSIYIKKNTNTEFKIKKDGKNLTLEKAWTADSLAKKALIKCCTTTGSDKECTLGEKINVIFNDSGSEYTLDSDKQSKKLKYEEDQENYNQGFKFTVEEDITLDSDGNKKIEKKGESNGSSYEIKEQTTGNETKWYLSKVASNA